MLDLLQDDSSLHLYNRTYQLDRSKGPEMLRHLRSWSKLSLWTQSFDDLGPNQRCHVLILLFSDPIEHFSANFRTRGRRKLQKHNDGDVECHYYSYDSRIWWLLSEDKFRPSNRYHHSFLGSVLRFPFCRRSHKYSRPRRVRTESFHSVAKAFHQKNSSWKCL